MITLKTQNRAVKSPIQYKHLLRNTDIMFSQQNKFKVRISNVYSDKSNFRTKQKCSVVKNT